MYGIIGLFLKKKSLNLAISGIVNVDCEYLGSVHYPGNARKINMFSYTNYLKYT